MNPKHVLKSFLMKRPLLLRFARNIRDGSPLWNTVEKKIKGRENKISIASSARLLNCSITIQGDYNKITIADDAFFKNVKFYITGNCNYISIADGVKFNKGGELWIEDENCSLSIGSFSSFEDAHIAVTEPHSKINIGNDCMFSNDIDVRTGDSHSILNAITGKRINPAKDVYIADHVWVGSHVSILKGAAIASNSVVATRSVVTKPFTQQGVLLAGTPAQIIKTDIDWTRPRIYETQIATAATAQH